MDYFVHQTFYNFMLLPVIFTWMTNFKSKVGTFNRKVISYVKEHSNILSNGILLRVCAYGVNVTVEDRCQSTEESRHNWLFWESENRHSWNTLHGNTFTKGNLINKWMGPIPELNLIFCSFSAKPFSNRLISFHLTKPHQASTSGKCFSWHNDSPP